MNAPDGLWTAPTKKAPLPQGKGAGRHFRPMRREARRYAVFGAPPIGKPRIENRSGTSAEGGTRRAAAATPKTARGKTSRTRLFFPCGNPFLYHFLYYREEFPFQWYNILYDNRNFSLLQSILTLACEPPGTPAALPPTSRALRSHVSRQKRFGPPSTAALCRRPRPAPRSARPRSGARAAPARIPGPADPEPCRAEGAFPIPSPDTGNSGPH